MSAIHSMYGSCFCFVFTFGKTRCLVRISDFLSFFADWVRVITIGATQSEQHCCLGHAPASQSHVAHTQHCKKQIHFLQRKWRRSLRFPNSNVHQTGLAPISDESAHNQSKKAKNLRYPQQAGKCPKSKMKQNTRTDTQHADTNRIPVVRIRRRYDRSGCEERI